jgi:predicted nucleic acid-binding protein
LRVFIDTSAILALLVPTDLWHEEARQAFAHLEAEEAPLVTTSYVLLETYALLGRRQGLNAVRRFREDFAPLLEVEWVDSSLHESGLDLLLEIADRDLSLVDVISFQAIQAAELQRVFAFDRHFSDRGFHL